MENEKVCSWCRSETEVKNEIESVFHKHHNSTKYRSTSSLSGILKQLTKINDLFFAWNARSRFFVGCMLVGTGLDFILTTLFNLVK